MNCDMDYLIMYIIYFYPKKFSLQFLNIFNIIFNKGGYDMYDEVPKTTPNYVHLVWVIYLVKPKLLED